jgi:hypothetical protein
MATKTDKTRTPKQLLSAYLKERVSGDHDAPHQGLPFISDQGVLRVRPTDWCDWLTAQGVEMSKREALQVLKDAGLTQKVYVLPAHDDYETRSYGLYTGKAPSGTSKLPRRASKAATA